MRSQALEKELKIIAQINVWLLNCPPSYLYTPKLVHPSTFTKEASLSIDEDECGSLELEQGLTFYH